MERHRRSGRLQHQCHRLRAILTRPGAHALPVGQLHQRRLLDQHAHLAAGGRQLSHGQRALPDGRQKQPSAVLPEADGVAQATGHAAWSADSEGGRRQCVGYCAVSAISNAADSVVFVIQCFLMRIRCRLLAGNAEKFVTVVNIGGHTEQVNLHTIDKLPKQLRYAVVGVSSSHSEG